MTTGKIFEPIERGGRRSTRSVLLPSSWLIIVFSLPALLSIATIFDNSYRTALLSLDAVILLFAFIDLIFFRKESLTLFTEGRDILSIGQKNAVDLHLECSSSRKLKVEVFPDIPLDFDCPQRGKKGVVMTLIGGHCRLRYHLIPNKRGAYRLGAHHLHYESRLGLWRRQERFSTERQVRVYPDLAMIRTYELLARQHRQYALVRASRLRGGESEFARLRDYSSDDDYRFIDWKASARRNKLTTREFQLESDQNIFLVLDSGRLMSGKVGGISQFDLALNSALLMAHVALRSGDRVGLMCFDQEIRAFLAPQGGAKSTARLVQATYGLHPELVESSYQKALGTFAARVKQRCLLVIFTQLIDDTQVSELSERLLLLGRKHLPLVILLSDTDLEAMVNAPIESSGSSRELYDRGAAAELLTWKQHAVTLLKKTGAHVIETPAHSLSNQVINRYLSIKAQHSL